jgi:hypothetical protein
MGKYSWKYSCNELLQFPFQRRGLWLNTLFEPVYARRLFPCWDEPRFRASFRLDLWLLNGLAAEEFVSMERGGMYFEIPNVQLRCLVRHGRQLPTLAHQLDHLPVRAHAAHPNVRFATIICFKMFSLRLQLHFVVGRRPFPKRLQRRCRRGGKQCSGGIGRID